MERLLEGSALNVTERGRNFHVRLLGRRRHLVEEGGQEVGVVNDNGELDENVPEGQFGLLQAVAD